MTLKILQRTFLCISVKCAPERFEDNWFLSSVPSFTENFKMARDVLCSTVLEVSTMQYSLLCQKWPSDMSCTVFNTMLVAIEKRSRNDNNINFYIVYVDFPYCYHVTHVSDKLEARSTGCEIYTHCKKCFQAQTGMRTYFGYLNSEISILNAQDETSIGYLGLRSSLTILGQMIRKCKAQVVDCIHAFDNQHCSYETQKDKIHAMQNQCDKIGHWSPRTSSGRFGRQKEVAQSVYWMATILLSNYLLSISNLEGNP